MLNELMNSTFQKELSEGKHTVVLKAWTYKPESDPKNDYICLEMLVDGDLHYKRNMFERDVSIFLSHTRRQLNMQDQSINPKTYLDDLVKSQNKLDMWVAYPKVPTKNGVRRVQNVYWTEPSAETAESADDAELPSGV